MRLQGGHIKYMAYGGQELGLRDVVAPAMQSLGLAMDPPMPQNHKPQHGVGIFSTQGSSAGQLVVAKQTCWSFAHALRAG